jgi:hypothetical protein
LRRFFDNTVGRRPLALVNLAVLERPAGSVERPGCETCAAAPGEDAGFDVGDGGHD